MMSKSGVRSWKMGVMSVIGRCISSITDLLSIGIGSAGVAPASFVLSGYRLRSVESHWRAAYRAAASGRLEACLAYCALGGKMPPPWMSVVIWSGLLDMIQA